jgi:integrase
VVRVPLKGVNRVRKKLADGRVVTYWYAWKGGPRLEGLPGSPEFHASYARAHEADRPRDDEGLSAVFDAFLDSADFGSLAPRTQSDYRKIIAKIDAEFGEFLKAMLPDRRARGEFLSWRDRLAKTSPRQADYAFTVLARVLSWAINRGLVEANPCEKPGGRLYHGTRAEKIWTLDDETRFLAGARPDLRLGYLLGVWTGQRKGDVIGLPWSAYDGAAIRLRQGKTGRQVVIPSGAPLKAELDATERRSPLILTDATGVPWKGREGGYYEAWKDHSDKVGIRGLTFADLRGTAVTRLAIAGCTEAEIASITGHSMAHVRTILDRHYLFRDPALARAAIAKLERGTKSPN